jgi:ectoine hydroxylase
MQKNNNSDDTGSTKSNPAELGVDKRPPSFSESEWKQWNECGYVVVENAVPPELIDSVYTFLGDKIDSLDGQFVNYLKEDTCFIEFIDLAKVLPKVVSLLGPNIWINHSHLNVNKVQSGPEQKRGPVGFHRDSNSFKKQCPSLKEPLTLKVVFHLNDCSSEGMGNTIIVPNSMEHPDPSYRLDVEGGVPLLCKKGTAVIFGNQVVHSASWNIGPVPRCAFFLTYAYRWLVGLDKCEYPAVKDSVRRQLLDQLDCFYADAISDKFYFDPDKLPIKSD